MAIAMYAYVAAGIVLFSCCVFIYFCLFVCFLTACFWQNKDACLYNFGVSVRR